MARCRSRRPGGVRKEDRVKGAGGGMVRLNYSVDLFGGERDRVGKNRGGDVQREDGGRGKRGVNVLHLLGKVVKVVKVITSEGGRRWRGGRGEEGREHGKLFPWGRSGGVDFGPVKSRFGC